MLANLHLKTIFLVSFATFVLIYNILLGQLLSFRPADLHLIESDASVVYDTKGNLLFKIHQDAPKIHHHVELELIPKACLQAIIATEDPTFFANIGVDAKGLTRGLLGELTGQNRGGSTISQQLVKIGQNNFFSRNPVEKVFEVLYAIKLNANWSKQQILEAYLNNAYFGNYHYGIGAAARLYFAKSVQKLSPTECTYLAGIPNRPVYFDPFTNHAATRQRQLVVIQLMFDHGFISREQAQVLVGVPINIALQNRVSLAATQKIIQAASREIFAHSNDFTNIENVPYIFTLNMGIPNAVILESIIRSN